jgi:hypothetical protein
VSQSDVRHAVERSGAKAWDILDTLEDANYEVKDVDPKVTTLFSRTAPGQWVGVPDAFFFLAKHATESVPKWTRSRWLVSWAAGR